MRSSAKLPQSLAKPHPVATHHVQSLRLLHLQHLFVFIACVQLYDKAQLYVVEPFMPGETAAQP